MVQLVSKEPTATDMALIVFLSPVALVVGFVGLVLAILIYALTFVEGLIARFGDFYMSLLWTRRERG
jgi:Na+-transporting methylmalonyl-CoA/oxaloacetate decarboxylase gamma subunit